MFAITFTSCLKTTSDNEMNISNENFEGEIYGVFVDSLTMANPYHITDTSIINEKFIDSVNKIPDTILINPIVQKPSKMALEIIKNRDVTFFNSMLSNNDSLISSKKIISREGHKIIFEKELKNYPGKEPQMLLFSPIGLNKSKNKASVIVTYSRGNLATFSKVYFLQKSNGKWRIESSSDLTRS